MNWNTVIRIVLMIMLLVSMSANIRLTGEKETALIIAATYRACLDSNMTLPYCEEFVFPAVAEELSRGEE